MPHTGRPGCPLNLTLEQLGARWRPVVIRDIMFGIRRSYGGLLAQSEQGMLRTSSQTGCLTASGLLTRHPDPTHRQKGIYSLTEAAIQLVPLLANMAAWGRRHTQPSEELSVRAELLENGGPPLWNAFMDELRHRTPSAPRQRSPLLITKMMPRTIRGSSTLGTPRDGGEQGSIRRICASIAKANRSWQRLLAPPMDQPAANLASV